MSVFAGGEPQYEMLQKQSDAGDDSRSPQSYVRERLDEQPDKTVNQVLLKPALVARMLGATTFLLILANCAALLADYLTGYNSLLVHKLVKFFYVELELNAPAFFSMLLLLFASLLLTVITVHKRKQKAAHLLEWTILSGGFLLMAFDEIAAIHERLIEPMRAIMGEQNLGFLYFAWVVPAIVLVTVLALFFLKFLWSLPMKTRLSFLIAATLYLGGAVGFELLEGKYSEIHGRENLIYITMTTVEETLEMVGTIVFIRALLGYFNDTYREVRLRFDDFTSNF
ncbi:MAG: hypothetical protein LH472_17085 [Pyrinomonadaceae bacterium]|nr:hypothetical protein [Pyrinomonadaceae bacterium]